MRAARAARGVVFSAILRLRGSCCRQLSDVHPPSPSTSSVNRSVADEPSMGDAERSSQSDAQLWRPSETFMSSLSKQDLSRTNKVLKEMEVFMWASRRAPRILTDEHWRHLVAQSDIKDRVGYLEYIYSLERSKRKDQKLKEISAAEYRKYLEEMKLREEKFQRGEMAYGPDMVQLVSNPLRQKKRIMNDMGSRVWKTMRLSDKPRLLFDFQFFGGMKDYARSALAKQFTLLIEENFLRREPFEMTFFNYDSDAPWSERFLRAVGHFMNAYQHQTILPDIVKGNLKSVCREGEDVVYVSSRAVGALKGPLDRDAYVVCVSMSEREQSFGASRRANVPARRVPLERAIAWRRGPKYIPYPNLVRIFDEVYSSNGNWRSAFVNNISRRHLLAPEELGPQRQAIVEWNRDLETHNEELMKMMQEATRNM